jgi:hypothetical protein
MAEKTIRALQDQMRAVERSHARTGRLLEAFHADAARALSEHGAALGVSADVVAPKEPPQ